MASSLADQIAGFKKSETLKVVREDEKNIHIKKARERHRTLLQQIQQKNTLTPVAERIAREHSRAASSSGSPVSPHKKSISAALLKQVRSKPKLRIVRVRQEAFNWRPYASLKETIASQDSDIVEARQRYHEISLEIETSQKELSHLDEQRKSLDIKLLKASQLLKLLQKNILYRDEEKERDELIERLEYQEKDLTPDFLAHRIQESKELLALVNEGKSILEQKLLCLENILSENKKVLTAFDREFRQLFLDKNKGRFQLLQSIRNHQPSFNPTTDTEEEQLFERAAFDLKQRPDINHFLFDLKADLSMHPGRYRLMLPEGSLSSEEIDSFLKDIKAFNHQIQESLQESDIASFLSEHPYELAFQEKAFRFRKTGDTNGQNMTFAQVKAIHTFLETLAKSYNKLLQHPFLNQTKYFGYIPAFTKGRFHFMAPSLYQLTRLESFHEAVLKKLEKLPLEAPVAHRERLLVQAFEAFSSPAIISGDETDISTDKTEIDMTQSITSELFESAIFMVPADLQLQSRSGASSSTGSNDTTDVMDSLQPPEQTVSWWSPWRAFGYKTPE